MHLVAMLPHIASILASLWFAPLHATSSSSATRSVIEIPGTGVRIAPPAGMVLPKLGSTLADPTGRLLIAVGTGDTAHDLEKDRVFRYVYPDPPESFAHNGVLGHLYRRHRKADGSGYDGWWLNARRGSRTLVVLATNTSTAPDAMSRLRGGIETIQWDGRAIAPELAFGARVVAPGFVLDPRSNGLALKYLRLGPDGDTLATLDLTAMPAPEGAPQAIVTGKCDEMMAISLANQPRTEPHRLRIGTADACDAWTLRNAPLSWALIAAPDPHIELIANGKAKNSDVFFNASSFRDAIQGMRLLR